jgi:hypothetical protein
MLKFWKKELNIDVSDKSTETANKLIEHISEAISASENFESFIGIPLILLMVAEIYHDHAKSIIQDSNEISFQGPVSLIEIYQQFIHLKLNRYCSVYIKKAMPELEQIIQQFMKEHELLGAYSLFGEDFFQLITKEQRDTLQFLKDAIHSGQRRQGIIYGYYIHNGIETVIFMHKSFQEYFAASWFAKQLLALRAAILKTPSGKMEEREKDLWIFQEKNLKDFLEKRMKVLFTLNFWRLFNLKVVEKCKSEELRKVLQKAVLGQFKLVQNHKDLLCDTDELGRNSFHFMLSLYKRAREITEELAPYSYSILNKGLRMKDGLFSKTPLDYLICHFWENESIVQGQLKNGQEEEKEESISDLRQKYIYIFQEICSRKIFSSRVYFPIIKDWILDKVQNHKELILDSNYEELKELIVGPKHK